MEQKSSNKKRTIKKKPSKSTHLDITTTSTSTERYSLRNKSTKKETTTPTTTSTKLPITRSNKRKLEQSSPSPTNTPKQPSSKKAKTMDNSKGKQKATQTSKKESRQKVSESDEQNVDNLPKVYNEKNNDENNESKMHKDQQEHKDFNNISQQSQEEEEEEENEEEEDNEEDNEKEDDNDDDEEEDEDEEDEDNEFARIRRNLGFQMQGLFGNIASSGSPSFRDILARLKSDEDPTMQLLALQELSEILACSSEETLIGSFSSDSFSRELVRIMKGPDQVSAGDYDDDMMLALAMSEGFVGGNPEVILLSCRCISNLLEIMPTAVTSMVTHGAIKVLCEKLKSIQYVDSADQILQPLEKISLQLPRAVVHEGGLSVVFMYFDFFDIHAQRIALRTAVNCMRGIDSESFSQIMEVKPILKNTMTYPDRSVVELTCLCWVKISENYRSQRELLERVITSDLIKVFFDLIPTSVNSSPIHPSAFQDLLRIFRAISKASPQLSFELLQLGIIDMFYQILTGSTESPGQTTPVGHHITLDNKWSDAAPTIMKTIVDLLPSVPKDDKFSSKRFKESAPVATRTRSASGSNNNDLEDVVITQPPTPSDPRIEWFKSSPDVLAKLDNVLIPLILDMYASTVNLRIRQLVTHTLVKLIHYSDADTLDKVLKNVELSSFLSGVLTRQEHPSLIVDALFQTEILIKKLPQVYHFLFEREGVLHEIESISKMPIVTEEDSTNNNNMTTKTHESAVDDDSDDTTTDVDNSQSKKDDNEEGDDWERKKMDTGATASSSSTMNSTSSNSQQNHFNYSQSHRSLGTDLQALLKSRYDLLNQQRLGRHNTTPNSNGAEKGIGRGSTRKYVIQLAQHFVKHYSDNAPKDDQTSENTAGSSLQELLQFTSEIMTPSSEDPLSKQTLLKLSAYLHDSDMGISSFELINTGLMKALVCYLADSNTLQSSLQDRITLFEEIFIENPNFDKDGSNSLKKLVVRLQEILSRFESFEVVTPIEPSSSTENLRNPTSMLAKQLRLKLTGSGEDIPGMYKQLMVSTHAVATFRVLEEYLLARISTSSVICDMEEDGDEEEEHLVLDEDTGMEIDDHEDGDTEMSETIVVKKSDSEEEDNSQKEVTGSPSKPTAALPVTSNKKEKKEGEWKIRFLLNGSVISSDSTVYAAVHQYETNSASDGVRRDIWTSSHPITYERVWVSAAEVSEEEGKKPTTPVCQLADATRPKELKEDSPCPQALLLLTALSNATFNKHSVGVSAQDFINRKLTSKMNHQLEEPLIVSSSCLPSWSYWLMSTAPYLFPFETRYLFIQSTSFGYSRLIARWQSLQMRSSTQNGHRNDTNEQQPMLGRMERQKVRIMRNQMLESAIKILDLFGSSPTVLEIEYMGEEGTGMGPTLEFYTCTSKEFSKHSLNMWRGSVKSDEGHVPAPDGLFPKSLGKMSSRSTKKIIQLYKTLGQFMAKGLLDFRIIDIPFSVAFFKVALGTTKPSPELLKEIDPALGKSIQMLQSYITQKREIYADETKSVAEKSAAALQIKVDGAKIEDLSIDFTLPGDDSYVLKPDGFDIPVTINNVEEYIDLLTDAIAGSGIAQQIAAFREGFNGLFAIDDLRLLTDNELVSLFGKTDEDWSYATLSDTFRADHGFTMESKPVQYLLETLLNFSDIEKRQFLQFATGSPRLPIGGWRSLRPAFTVVCKESEKPLTPDDYLPSVMTCANYFKMPAYSSKEVLRTKLLISLKEGQNSFLLS